MRWCLSTCRVILDTLRAKMANVCDKVLMRIQEKALDYSTSGFIDLKPSFKIFCVYFCVINETSLNNIFIHKEKTEHVI